jgi:hypothetical protein
VATKYKTVPSQINSHCRIRWHKNKNPAWYCTNKRYGIYNYFATTLQTSIYIWQLDTSVWHNIPMIPKPGTVVNMKIFSVTTFKYWERTMASFKNKNITRYLLITENVHGPVICLLRSSGLWGRVLCNHMLHHNPEEHNAHLHPTKNFESRSNHLTLEIQ